MVLWKAEIKCFGALNSMQKVISFFDKPFLKRKPPKKPNTFYLKYGENYPLSFICLFS